MQSAKPIRLYGNWLVLSPDNVQMFRTDEKRARWYLNRQLAEVCGDKTIKLLFKPNGLGNAEMSEFYLAHKQNICVVCGSDVDLTKHHVVPYMYRKHFPFELKSWSSHDVLLLCIDDHEKYEQHANKLKRELLGPTIKESQRMPAEIKDLWVARGFAKALLFERDRIPEDRKQVMREKVRSKFGVEPDDDNLRNLLAERKPDWTPEIQSSGRLSLERYEGTLNEFCIMWRKHFVAHMKPKHLPHGWSVDYLLADDGVAFDGACGNVSGTLDDSASLDNGIS